MRLSTYAYTFYVWKVMVLKPGECIATLSSNAVRRSLHFYLIYVLSTRHRGRTYIIPGKSRLHIRSARRACWHTTRVDQPRPMPGPAFPIRALTDVALVYSSWVFSTPVSNEGSRSSLHLSVCYHAWNLKRSTYLLSKIISR